MANNRGYIVFVDDDKEDHELFKMAMEKVPNFQILCAYDGDEALQLLHEHKNNIFAVISDIDMPRISGLELKRIIEATPELKLMAIPFIFLSASTDPVIVKEAYALGIQGFVEKSSDFEQTIQLLDHFIKFWSSTIHPNAFRKKYPARLP